MGITLNKTLPSGYTATYARALSSPSLRLDQSRIELNVAIYKDADARFAGSEPVEFDRQNLELTMEETEAIAKIIYGVMDRLDTYPGSQKRDPDPEKETASMEDVG